MILIVMNKIIVLYILQVLSITNGFFWTSMNLSTCAHGRLKENSKLDFEKLPVLPQTVKYFYTKEICTLNQKLSEVYEIDYLFKVFNKSIEKFNEPLQNKIIFSSASQYLADVIITMNYFPNRYSHFDNYSDYGAIYFNNNSQIVINFNFLQSFYEWEQCSNEEECPRNTYEVASLHMFGHLFGLSDTLFSNSIMNMKKYDKYSLTNVDRDSIKTLYTYRKVLLAPSNGGSNVKKKSLIFGWASKIKSYNKMCQLFRYGRIYLHNSEIDRNMYYVLNGKNFYIIDTVTKKELLLKINNILPVENYENVVSTVTYKNSILFYTNKTKIYSCNKNKLFTDILSWSPNYDCKPGKILALGERHFRFFSDKFGNVIVFTGDQMLKKLKITKNNEFYMERYKLLNIDQEILDKVNIVENSPKSDFVIFGNIRQGFSVIYNMHTENIIESNFVKTLEHYYTKEIWGLCKNMFLTLNEILREEII